MILSSGCPPWPPDHPRTRPRTGIPTPPPGARPSLANLDIRHEIERDYLEEWSGPDEVKQRLMAALEARWQRDREPIVQGLTQLEEQIRAPRKAHRPESVRHKGRACSGRTRVERRSAA